MLWGEDYNKMEKFTRQDDQAVTFYQSSSKMAQEKYFDALIEPINIEEGWEIIDIGCGTGNNTFKLSKLVGNNGSVFGIDPITERIEKARELYEMPNLSFQEAFGNQVCQFGDHFDIVVSSTAMHWLTYDEKIATFAEIYKSLKDGGQFVFNLSRSSVVSHNKIDHIAGKLDQFENFYPIKTANELEEICRQAGFDGYISVEEKDFSLRFEDFDELTRWYTASIHYVEYEDMVSKMKKMYQMNYPNENLNDEVIYVDQYFMCYCKK